MIVPTMKLLGNLRRVDTGRQTIVQQHFKEEVNINTIMRRFGVTGQMPEFLPQGMYGDFTGIEDYDDAVSRIERANDAFMALPAEVRERFDNDPSQLIRAASISSEDEFGKLVFPVKEGGSGEPVVPPKSTEEVSK